MTIDVKALVCRLTGISEEAYNHKVFESGMQYLDLNLSKDQVAHKALSSSPLFWRWWTRQFERRNRILLSEFDFNDALMQPSIGVQQNAEACFDLIHDVNDMKIRINKFVVREAFRTARVDQERKIASGGNA